LRENCTSRLSERAEAGRKLHLSRLYSVEVPVMGMERRAWAIEVTGGQLSNQEEPTMVMKAVTAFIGGTSRMRRESQVRICEGLGVKFLLATRFVPRA